MHRVFRPLQNGDETCAKVQLHVHRCDDSQPGRRERRYADMGRPTFSLLSTNMSSRADLATTHSATSLYPAQGYPGVGWVITNSSNRDWKAAKMSMCIHACICASPPSVSDEGSVRIPYLPQGIIGRRSRNVANRCREPWPKPARHEGWLNFDFGALLVATECGMRHTATYASPCCSKWFSSVYCSYSSNQAMIDSVCIWCLTLRVLLRVWLIKGSVHNASNRPRPKPNILANGSWCWCWDSTSNQNLHILTV